MPRLSYAQGKSIRNQPYKRLARKVPVPTKRYVKSQITRNLTTKAHYVAPVNQDLSYDAPLVQKLSAIVLDNGGVELASEARNSSKVRFTGMTVRGFLQGSSTAALASNTIGRMLIFQWFKDDGVDVPTYTDLFEQTGGSSFNVNEPTSTIKGKYFKVLHDQRLAVGADSVAMNTNIANIKLYSAYIPASRARQSLQYNQDALTGKNQIYMIALSTVTNASTHEPILSFSSRLNFKD